MPNKLTDSKIVKALECCVPSNRECADCPFYDNGNGEFACIDYLQMKALDLINRLQAENERLKNILMCFMDALGNVRKLDDIDEISLIPLMSELNKQYRAELKAEAYKEYADFDSLHEMILPENINKAINDFLKQKGVDSVV